MRLTNGLRQAVPARHSNGDKFPAAVWQPAQDRQNWIRWVSGRLCIFRRGVPVGLGLPKLGRESTGERVPSRSRFAVELLHVTGFKTGHWLASVIK